MGWIGRTKRTPGGGPAIPTISSANVQTIGGVASTLVISDDVSIAYISGTTAIAALRSATIIPGRTITFIGVTTTGPAFANNNDTTTQYQMDLGGSNRTIAPQDILCLMQKSDGTWLMLYTTNN
jgi:hypothetical protein